MDGEWFKVLVESAFTSWTGALPNRLYGVWVKLLAVTKLCGRNGVTLRNACNGWLRKAGVTQQEVASLIKTAGENIIDDGDTITIRNWREYQGDRTNADRQARYRDKAKAVTSPLRNAVTIENRGEQRRIEEKRTEETTPPLPPASGGSDDDGFDDFWKAYPRKIGKGAARRAWQKTMPSRPPMENVLDSIERAKASEQWQKDDGQFIPHPSTWLNQERWDDEPEEVFDPNKAGGRAPTPEELKILMAP
jgi:hypothetical protein